MCGCLARFVQIFYCFASSAVFDYVVATDSDGYKECIMTNVNIVMQVQLTLEMTVVARHQDWILRSFLSNY